MAVIKRKTAGEMSQDISKDNTKYNIIEVGHALADTIEAECRKSVALYYNMIDEPEFCVVMVIASDPIIKKLKRRKFYCWPYLPSPRPNQTVWLYRKARDSYNRLWVLPDAKAMAKLASCGLVDDEFQTMQAWTAAFYSNTFWEYIRYEHGISMLSESEYLTANREKLIQAGCKVPPSNLTNPFDFSKIAIEKVVDTQAILPK